ncbi:MAG: DUF1553 domain-containing protein [Planctomycetaceae bacterium]|nr:DUF1553 domain-containing protein [Planctomycetaceae bacterium]
MIYTARLTLLFTVLTAGTLRADDVVTQWRFEENTGAECRDESSSKLHGEYLDGVTQRRGRKGLAAAFSHQNAKQRIEIPIGGDSQTAIAKLIDGSFTFEAWLLDDAPPPDGTRNYAIFYKADRSRFIRNSLWFYRARQDGSYRFTIADQGDHQARVTFTPLDETGAGDGVWHHYVIVVDRSDEDPAKHVIRGYRDSRLIDENPIPADIGSVSNDGNFVIGNDHHRSSSWRGAIDELSLYDTALSADRVRQRFASFATREAVTQRKRASEEKQRFFENTIRPLLVAKCVDCHSGEESSESPLAIVSRESLLTGGDFGPAIIPGRAEDSTLIRAVRWTHKALRMPQDREDRLSNKEIADLIRWINDGAVWPGSDATTNAVVHRKIEAAGRKIETDHWAFQSRTIVEPPQVKDSRWMAGPIDRFVESARQRRNLKAVGPATRGTLIRRLTFDLIGLPPTPTEVEAFVNDARPDDEAIAAVADRLLTSKHYGERWGRHWMDVARYADTQGDVGDYPIPDDWRYRNWIIDSLNEDMPFNDFLRAQIAGDVIAARGLADGTLDEVEARKLVIATGYLALSQRYGNSKAEHLHLTYENAIDTIGRGVLGLTLRCSRCHDHPFDPILQTDYYGLYGILDSTTMPWMGMSIEKSPSGLVPTRPDEQLQKAAADYWTTISRYEYQINNHFRPWLKPTLDEFKKVKKQLEESSDPSVTEKLTAQRDELLSRHSGKFRELMLHGLDWLKKEKTNNARRPPFEMVFAVGEGQPHDSAIHRRGEPQRKGQIVPRRFLQVVDGPAAPKIRSGSGRLELADWLTRDDHPLVPRVVVNRIWQRHFGRGLVVTTDNFGVRGESPSHPELLDWLTQQFVNDGWSLKQLHRRIVLSQTYRLSSDSDAIDDDPDNVYLTRFARRRLEGEAIRDAMLAVSGELDITQGQGHPLPPWDQKRYGLNGPFDSEFETNRRSVYLLTQRLFNHSFLGLFDPPDRNAATARRSSSDVPGQSLFLMNSPYVRRQAEAFADRLLKDHSNNTDRIAWAFHLAYGRSVTPDEQDSFDTYIQRLQRTAQEIGKSDNSYERLLWTSITRAILTSNEFFFVD